jgi:4,5-DOPA dioxygenase extradiol
MFPSVDIPVIQLSLDRTQSPQFHYELGKELLALRNRGVLIVGSGNIVHNLRTIAFQDKAFDWAIEFDQTVRRLIEEGDHQSIIRYQNLGQAARLAIPTNEHYLPLLYILALQDKQEQIHFFADQVTLGSISMRSVVIQ